MWSNKQNIFIQSKYTPFLFSPLHLAQLIFFFSFASYGFLLNFDLEILSISDSFHVQNMSVSHVNESISLPVLYSHNFIYILVAVNCYENDIERMRFYSHPTDPKLDDPLGVDTILQQLALLGFTFHLHQRNIKTHNDILCSRQLFFDKCMCDVSWCSLASCPWPLYI